jgi:hypothetical protein
VRGCGAPRYKQAVNGNSFMRGGGGQMLSLRAEVPYSRGESVSLRHVCGGEVDGKPTNWNLWMRVGRAAIVTEIWYNMSRCVVEA